MDYATTHILEQGMAINRASIAHDARCPACRGEGQVRAGCAITHALYWPCVRCLGTGRRRDDDPLPSAWATALHLEACYQRDLARFPAWKNGPEQRVYFATVWHDVMHHEAACEDYR